MANETMLKIVRAGTSTIDGASAFAMDVIVQYTSVVVLQD